MFPALLCQRSPAYKRPDQRRHILTFVAKVRGCARVCSDIICAHDNCLLPLFIPICCSSWKHKMHYFLCAGRIFPRKKISTINQVLRATNKAESCRQWDILWITMLRYQLVSQSKRRFLFSAGTFPWTREHWYKLFPSQEGFWIVVSDSGKCSCSQRWFCLMVQDQDQNRWSL